MLDILDVPKYIRDNHLTRIDPKAIYLLWDVRNNRARMLPEKLMKQESRVTSESHNRTFDIEPEHLKFLIDNKLIHIKGFKVTAAGKIATVENYESEIDKDELKRLQKIITQEKNEFWARMDESNKRVRAEREAEEARKAAEEREAALAAALEAGIEPPAPPTKLEKIKNGVSTFFHEFSAMLDEFDRDQRAGKNNYGISESEMRRINETTSKIPNIGAQQVNRGIMIRQAQMKNNNNNW